MSARHALVLIAALAAVTGCSGSSGGTTANSTPTPAASATTPSASPTPVPLVGTHAVDITWSPRPQLGVPCPKGMHGYCTRVLGAGYDDALGQFSLDEVLATPSDASCSKGTVKGSFSLADDPKSALRYTSVGKFCWTTTTGKFVLKLLTGTGKLKNATGKLTAKISNGVNLVDEWKGTLHVKA